MDVQSYGEVEHAHVDYNGFNESIFTFYVGRSKERFAVHAGIVSLHSRVLRQLIEGPFREGIERRAELPEVDPRTFNRFLAFAYYTSNNPSGSETTAQIPTTRKISISRLIELLLAKDHKNFQCKSCYNTPDLKFSLTFPRCDECSQDEFINLNWKTRCVVIGCSRDGDYIHGAFCAECLQALGVFDWNKTLADDGIRKLQLDVPQYLEELQNFHFKIPLRVKEILGAKNQFFLLPHSAKTSLLDTARLAIFADIYAVKPLSQAALVTLYWKLTQELLDEESITVLCELANYVYSNTINRPVQTRIEGTHILRRILCQFIATHRDKFTISTTFMQLVCQEEELASDILLALSFVE